VTRDCAAGVEALTSLTLVRRIAARPAVVFELLTTAEGIAAWWGPDDGPMLVAEIDARVGGRFRIRFATADGNEHESSGENLTVDPPYRLAMTWRWHGVADDTGPSEVEIVLRPIPDGTELVFTYSRLRDEEIRDSHARGWAGALNKLAALFAARRSIPWYTKLSY
jgi:uncharacterized protein YndB with AHSA1/START domain